MEKGRIIIVGATSGIGKEVALCYIKAGWKVGLAGRRMEELQKLQLLAPQQIVIQPLDVTSSDAPQLLNELVIKNGGMDVFLLSAGVGKQNMSLDLKIEEETAVTNVEGFIRMVTAAFHYFEQQGNGHIAAISSIAGTKGLGVAPAYSATKRFQSTYLESLEQLARLKKISISFTDIRPGFVDTPLLKQGAYPLLMDVVPVARSIVKAISSRKRVVVIDWRYRLLVFFWQMIPKRLWVRLPIKS